MKLKFALIAVAALFAGPVFASSPGAVGETILNLDDLARFATVQELNQQIATLDQNIAEAHAQSLVNAGFNNAPNQTATYMALETALRTQRDELVNRRNDLQ